MAARAELLDWLRAAGLGAGFAASTVLPGRLDGRLVEALVGLSFRLRPGRLEQRAAQIAAVLGRSEAEAREIARENARLEAESAWGRVRGLRHRGWQPEVHLEGREHLERALAAGRGALMWRWSFCSTPVVKIALWQAQIPLVHLSWEDHGAWSQGWVGRRLIAPLYRRSEDGYLAERIVIPRGSLAYMKLLIKRLEANAVVSIVGDHTGSQNVTTPFFDGECRFATGAPALAWKTGASLLTAHAIAEGPGRYRVVVAEPIEVDRSVDRRQSVRRAVFEFSRRMQAAIAQHPASWGGWKAFLAGDDIFGRPDAEHRASLEAPGPTNSAL